MPRRPIVPFAAIGSACLSLSHLAAQEDSIRGFVSVEPFEVRLEAVVKVDAFRDSWRLGGPALDSATRQEVLENVGTLFESGVQAVSPGATIEFTDRTARFIRLDPERGYLQDEREAIPVGEALVGITRSAEVRDVRELQVDWGWFAPGQDRLVLEIASRGKPSARYVTPGETKVNWRMEGEAEVPQLLAVPAVEWEKHALLQYLAIPAIALLVGAAFLVLRHRQKSPAWVGWLTIGGIACGVAALRVKVERVSPPSAEDTDEIVYASLRNIYHAFDFRDEEAIYDTLEKTVSGPLLEEVYLEVRRSLELENTGGPRVRVYEIALRDCEAESVAGENDTLPVLANWATIGEVTHWGHTHERTNRYEARMVLAPVGDGWKVTGLDLLNEERIQKVSRRVAAPASRKEGFSTNGGEEEESPGEPTKKTPGTEARP